MADDRQLPDSTPPSSRRGGWQLPGLAESHPAAPPATRTCAAVTRGAARRRYPPRRDPGQRAERRPRPAACPPADPGGGCGPPVLAAGVAGAARQLSQGTVQNNNGSTTVMTLRLERYDPSGGRASVATVRLRGSRAIGFDAEGDWVGSMMVIGLLGSVGG